MGTTCRPTWWRTKVSGGHRCDSGYCHFAWAKFLLSSLLQKSCVAVFPTSHALQRRRHRPQNLWRTAVAASPTCKCQTAALLDTRASLLVSIVTDMYTNNRSYFLSESIFLQTRKNLQSCKRTFTLEQIHSWYHCCLLTYINICLCSPSIPNIQKHDRLCILLFVTVQMGILLILLAAPTARELCCFVLPWLWCIGDPLLCLWSFAVVISFFAHASFLSLQRNAPIHSAESRAWCRQHLRIRGDSWNQPH